MNTLHGISEKMIEVARQCMAYGKPTEDVESLDEAADEHNIGWTGLAITLNHLRPEEVWDNGSWGGDLAPHPDRKVERLRQQFIKDTAESESWARDRMHALGKKDRWVPAGKDLVAADKIRAKQMAVFSKYKKAYNSYGGDDALRKLNTWERKSGRKDGPISEDVESLEEGYTSPKKYVKQMEFDDEEEIADFLEAVAQRIKSQGKREKSKDILKAADHVKMAAEEWRRA